MKRAHLQAILWMRWRVLVNRISRRGKTGRVLMVLLALVALCLAASNFIGALVIGYELLGEAKPLHIMLAWGGLSAALLFFWMVGLMMELQRSESMSFQSLLHLPSSLLGVHLYNYIGSFVSLSLFLFLPLLLGFACASVLVFGPVMLLLFPLIAGFVGVLTALTYQLRGWLGTLMNNKRKRKNAITLITIGFVLLVQIPNFVNMMNLGDGLSMVEFTEQRAAKNALQPEESSGGNSPELGAEVGAAGEVLGPEEPSEDLLDDAAAYIAHKRSRRQAKLALADKWGTRACLLIPFGWLALGARSLSDGHLMYALLCALGLFGITVVSLRRSYGTTLRFVTGVGSAEAAIVAPSIVLPPDAQKPLFVARDLPFFGEGPTCVGLAGIRNLWRAPEFKMLLLGPLFMLVFAGILWSKGDAPDIPRLYRPAIGLGGIALGLVSMLQLLQNQFGLDREGFRAFLLSPLPRDQILKGKNLAMAPFAVGIGFLPIFGSQLFVPMGWMYFASTLLLSVAGFLLICLAGNWVSIRVPMRFKDGSLQADNAKVKVILMQFGSLLLGPVILLPVAIPLGLALIVEFLGLASGVLLYGAASCLVLLLSGLLYRILIPHQGRMLQQREQRILDVLTRAID